MVAHGTHPGNGGPDPSTPSPRATATDAVPFTEAALPEAGILPVFTRVARNQRAFGNLFDARLAYGVVAAAIGGILGAVGGLRALPLRLRRARS